MQTSDSTRLVSDHIELKQLADGVYAAIGIPGGAAYSNAGIIDLGNQTLVFDSLETPKAAADLRQAAEQLTGRPATYVIISHTHSDHWFGSQVFPAQTPILTTHKTYESMPDWFSYIKELQEDPSEQEEWLKEMQARLEHESDPRWIETLQASIPRTRHMLEALPTLDLRLPDTTFDGGLVFHGSGRRVELLTRQGGHTDSDAYLVLPEERIMFMGDLGFFQCQPFAASGNPEIWRAQLQEIEATEIDTFVPGHGPLGSKADVALQREYLEVLEKLVAQVIEAGDPIEEAMQLTLPEPFDRWLMGGMGRFEANVHSFYRRLSGED